jgi:hypothetical protein
MAYEIGDTITGKVLQKGKATPTTVTIVLTNEYQVWWYNTNYPGFTVVPATPPSPEPPK